MDCDLKTLDSKFLEKLYETQFFEIIKLQRDNNAADNDAITALKKFVESIHETHWTVCSVFERFSLKHS